MHHIVYCDLTNFWKKTDDFQTDEIFIFFAYKPEFFVPYVSNAIQVINKKKP